MEESSVLSDDEALRDRTVATMPSKDDYEGLDVFGTEAFDSVCGVDILVPFYGPDVKRVISLWSTLLLASTSMLTLGFFGCFRRLKGATLDLSRNLWNEDIFWTSLVIFLLTCLAITCGLSALASHTNLYSHAKVLGFQRVFRWCFALHAAAALFTLIVALKLTLGDILEAENGVPLTAMRLRETVEDSRALKRPNNPPVNHGGHHSQSPAGPDPPSSVDESFLQTSSVNDEAPVPAGNSGQTEAGARGRATTEAAGFLTPGEQLVKHSSAWTDILHGEAEGRQNRMDFVRETRIRCCQHERKALGKTASTGVQYPKAQRYIRPTAFRRIASSGRAKEEGLFLASGLLLKGGREENHSDACMSVFECSHAYANTSPFRRRPESGTLAAQKTFEPSSEHNGKAGETFLLPPATGLSVPRVSHDHELSQRSHTAPLFHHRRVTKRKTQTGVQVRSAFIPKLAENPFAKDTDSGGKGHPPMTRATAVRTTGSDNWRNTQRLNPWCKAEEHIPRVAVLIFLEGVNGELRAAADAATVPEMKNELGPVRESQIHRVMLYLVTALDYFVAVLQVVCLIYTWRLAAKIGAMYGLKILKIPF